VIQRDASSQVGKDSPLTSEQRDSEKGGANVFYWSCHFEKTLQKRKVRGPLFTTRQLLKEGKKMVGKYHRGGVDRRRDADCGKRKSSASCQLQATEENRRFEGIPLFKEGGKERKTTLCFNA